MKKPLIAIAVVALLVAGVFLLASDGDDPYLVRGYFDNGSFLVPDEEVRVAGANVGVVDAVDVSMPGEVVGYEDGKPVREEGKAVVVMRIDDPAFQDFRRDANCLIRPQSLIGERFVDCRPTLPRAPGSEPPPQLDEVPEGEPGEGQLFLGLQNNGTTVDPDLVNNIMRLPYAQRFRLILNELGASFATRGEDIAEIVQRANPALRDTVRLIGILADQRKQLAQLAADGEAIMEPLARERRAFAGFFDKSGEAAQATAERRADLERSLAKFPVFLREFRSTMTRLKGFSDAALPVTESLGRAAPSLTEATRALGPFTDASTVALKSLGDAGEASGPLFRAADPVVLKTRGLARSGARPLTNFYEFLGSTQASGGFENLMRLIYNTVGSVNGFDGLGHVTRTFAVPVNCFDYIPSPVDRSGQGCGGGSKFPNNSPVFSSSSSLADLDALLRAQRKLERNGGVGAPDGPGIDGATAAPRPEGEGETRGKRRADPQAPELGGAESLDGDAGADSEAAAQRALLDYLLGP